jgi:hypothetical protein
MDFIPQNDLEVALVAAATDPAARPRFYELLSKSDLLIVDENPDSAEPLGRRVLEQGRTLAIRQWDVEGVRHTGVFSSAARISAIVDRQVRTLAINARALFEMVGQDRVVLNPGSPYGKLFTPEEIASVIDGSIFAPRGTVVIPEARQVMLGQPTNYPTHVTGALATFFKAKKQVRAAYLAHMFDPKSGVAPHTVIGVDVDDGVDVQRLTGEVGIVLESIVQKGEVVDLIRITGDGISDYMTRETKPFYRRKLLGLF